MKRIYLDNCSTSFPKAPGVSSAMQFFTDEVGCNIGRGNYSEAYSAAMVAYETRELIGKLANFDDPKNVIFTLNITASMNFILKGYLKSGDHVLVSSMEHNATMRPLVQLEKNGVSFSRIPCDTDGYINIDEIEQLIMPNTKAIVMLHASNICGTILDIKSVGEIAKRRGLTFVVDAAQTFGIVPIDMQEMNIDVLCFTGHKSLLGPQGIGGFIIKDHFVKEIDPLISGGTGSLSDSEEVPEFLPDRFESGTMNLPAVYGLNAALKYIIKNQDILKKEQELICALQKGIENIDGVRIVGERDPFKRCPVLSIDFTNADNAEVGFRLENEFDIMTRCGLHCSPSGHKTLNTFPQGTVRFSAGHFTTEEDIAKTVEAIKFVLAK